ncbi:exported hypothetical protein [Candidatus Magnetomoraceae bacterium gMMP-1]
MKKLTLTALLCIFLWSCSGLQTISYEPNLDTAINNIVKTLVTQGNLKVRPVLVSPNDFYDAETKLSLPFSILLREKTAAALAKHNVCVLLPGNVDEDKILILSGKWQKQRDKLNLFFKVTELKKTGPQLVAAGEDSVHFSAVDPKLLKPDLNSWARYIVRDLESKVQYYSRRSVNLRPVIIKTADISKDFGKYLSNLLRPAMSESNLFTVLDPVTELRNIDTKTLRTRSIKPNYKNSMSLTSSLVKADCEMQGSAYVYKNRVDLMIYLRNQKGFQIASTRTDLPASLFDPSMFIKQPKITDDLWPGSLDIEISTNRGDESPTYYENEDIKFVLRVNQQAFVYIFNFDTKGEAFLLWPARGAKCKKLNPGMPLILPDDGCPYDLKVRPPFGRDIVWAAASTT